MGSHTSRTHKTSQTSSSPHEDRQNTLVWCTLESSKITLYNTISKEKESFNGESKKMEEMHWSHVKEIPNTPFLMSLDHYFFDYAKFEIFNTEKRKRICKFKAIRGEVGYGDISYNSNRNFAALVPVVNRKAYHLFDCSRLKVISKPKWQPFHLTNVTSLDLNPQGNKIATIDRYGCFLISEVETNAPLFGKELQEQKSSFYNRCRWNPIEGSSTLFVTFDSNKLNVFDTEKKELLLHNSVALEGRGAWSKWIDCRKDGNLVAAAGDGRKVKIFDNRQGKVVKTFENVHSGNQNQGNCLVIAEGAIQTVRWNDNGNMLATASRDGYVQLLDFRTSRAMLRVSVGENSKPRV